MIYQPEEQGQGLVEYSLILVLIAVTIILILTAISGRVEFMYSAIDSAVEGAIGS